MFGGFYRSGALPGGGQGRTGGLLGSLPASLQPTGNIGSGPSSICLLLMWLWWLMLLETSTDKHSGRQLQIHSHAARPCETLNPHCRWEETAEEILIMIPILTKVLRFMFFSRKIQQTCLIQSLANNIIQQWLIQNQQHLGEYVFH